VGNLTDKKLKSLYKKNSFQEEGVVTNRFETISSLINKIKEDEYIVTIDNDIVYINNKKVRFLNNENPTVNKFGPVKDRLRIGEVFGEVKKTASNFFAKNDKNYELVVNIGSLLSGLDFKSYEMKDEYRIISSSSIEKDDYSGSVLSKGQSRYSSSQFADNNYFFNIMKFIQDSNSNKENFWDDTIMNLRYPNQILKQELDDNSYSKEYKIQKNILEYGFAAKFLWMWANKENVIHPISLLVFKDFLNSPFVKKIIKKTNEEYTAEKIINMKLEEFIKVWPNISDKILEYIKIEKDAENIKNISKQISKISIEDIKVVKQSLFSSIFGILKKIIN
jgi:hypothetical protein